MVSQVNPEYLSVNWETAGGGAFAVIPLREKGRLPERIPLFRGHTSVVLDTDWSAILTMAVRGENRLTFATGTRSTIL